MKSSKGLYILLLLTIFYYYNGQVLPSYNMANMTVNDCRAKFYDDGGPTNNYTSVFPGGSSYTFAIINNNPAITMTFNPSGTQTQIFIGDYIKFHNAIPPNAGNLIAGPFTNIPISGTLAPVTSTTGTLVVVFTEDGSGSGFGWNGGWYSTAPPPTPPTASLSAIPSCSASIITLTTNVGVLCDSLKPNFFSISGPIFPVISTIIPVPCNNGTTNVIQINLAQPLDKNCSYSINSTLFRADQCDSVYKYPNIINTFSIGNCPIQASLNVTSTNTVCAYSCSANVSAVTPASVCLNLTYTWDNGLPSTPGPHAVCPSVTTVYNCTITETSTSNSVVVTNTIYVLDPQINPVANPTVCQSTGNIPLTATPPGGVWLGPGITNSVTGIFNTNAAGAGVKTVTYQVGNCTATIQLTVIQISAGNPDAACLGGPSFTVSGGTPTGGTWYGDPDITSGGIFTPTIVGTHTVLYTVGTCTSTAKTINVASAITVPTTAITLCKSQWWTRFYSGYGITPYGGRYTGAGIVNSVLGTFSPSIAGPGTHVITYSLATGCFDTFTVNVLDIDVTPSTATTCPSHAPFNVGGATPSGGAWTCTNSAGSILNASTGSYDPSIAGLTSHTDVLVYTAPNGCSDTLFMKALVTTINDDSLFFCNNSPTLQISSNFTNFGYSPAGGVYSGTGVSLVGSNYVFNPATAGPGVHTVYYDINTCTDSIKMVVYPSMMSGFDATVCSSHPTMMVISPPMPVGTTWSGPGIITPSLGVFNPGGVIADNSYTLNYTNKGGCGGSVNIYVYQYVPATISNLASAYCFRDTNYVFGIAPNNGTFTSIGTTLTPNVFNPSIVGAGTYTFTYEFGVGACYTSTNVIVKVHPELTTVKSLTKDTVCQGEASTISILASGGLPTVSQYTYTWSNGLISLNSHNVVPYTTTMYTVETSDGCSDPAIDTLLVTVAPQFYPSFATTSIQCYGDNGQATVNITPPGSFSYTWVTSPVQSSSVLAGIAGKNYNLKIRNLTTGCSKDTSIKIPGYDAIQALFNPNPNIECVPLDQSTVTFLDLSNGATTGTWEIDGTTQPYSPGQSVSYEFSSPGSKVVTLKVQNIGNCPSEYSMSICIEESRDIFVPDIFSPNNDGANDVFYVRGSGIREMKLLIYDRWGNKVFESHDPADGWKGDFNGKNAESGIYAYYLEVKLFNDKVISQKGDVTLIR